MEDKKGLNELKDTLIAVAIMVVVFLLIVWISKADYSPQTGWTQPDGSDEAGMVCNTAGC